MTTTNDTSLALLRAVCESPDDDTPRLVLADWLEENGEPERAEFIRIGVEIAMNRADDHDDDWKMRANLEHNTNL